MAKPKYTAKCFLQKEDGAIVPFDSISEEEKKEVFAKMSKRLSEGMSRYCSQHPEEFEKL